MYPLLITLLHVRHQIAAECRSGSTTLLSYSQRQPDIKPLHVLLDKTCHGQSLHASARRYYSRSCALNAAYRWMILKLQVAGGRLQVAQPPQVCRWLQTSKLHEILRRTVCMPKLSLIVLLYFCQWLSSGFSREHQ